MKKFLLLTILLPISGCQLLAYSMIAARENPTPQTLKWTEEVETIDGKIIDIDVKQKYSTKLSTDFARDWDFEDLHPVAFDLVNNVPWVVATIDGLAPCSKFNFPREGLVFFKYEGKSWIVVPYDQTPKNLHVNLIQSPVAYRDEGAGQYYGKKITLDSKKLTNRAYYANNDRYFNKDNSGKTISEIVKSNLESGVANSDSCYYMNPPLDPDEKRSLTEFSEKIPVALQARLVKINEDEIALTDEESTRVLQAQRKSINCEQKIGRVYIAQLAKENQERFAAIAGTPDGIFKSAGTAIRVELNSKDRMHSFYLPRRGFRMAQISVMNCQADRVVVDFDRDSNVIPIIEYDYNARLLNKWVVHLPFASKDWHTLYNLSIDQNRINITLVDFERTEIPHGGTIIGKIKKQYFFEAELLSSN